MSTLPQENIAEPVSNAWSLVNRLLDTQYSGEVIALVVGGVLVGASLPIWRWFIRAYLSKKLGE